MLLGLDNAGKTALLRRLTGGGFAAAAPTVGFDVQSLRRPADGLRVDVVDVGGAAALRPYWRNYAGGGVGSGGGGGGGGVGALAFAVDSADSRRLGEAALELAQLLADERLAAAPLLVLANKQDLASARPAHVIGDALGLDLVRGRAWRMQGCSAKEGYGVEEGMTWLVGQVGGQVGGGGGGG